MKDRFWPGAATGLPWASKPVFTAVSCGEPGAGVPSGDVQLRGRGRRGRRRSRRQFERSLAAAAGERQNPGQRRSKRDSCDRIFQANTAQNTFPHTASGNQPNKTAPRRRHCVRSSIAAKALPNAYAFFVSRLSQRLASRRTLFGAVPP